MNREPKKDERQWTAAAISADPVGALAYMRDLIDQRHAWHRKFDRAEKRMKEKYRGRLEVLEAENRSLRGE